mmetsp:Transcript_72002/g.154058  ORF Transcript_72002/g.154058 Transcript_72002/m.154058 type:complete len:239 (-) Transcript_72002:1178-1894(-)
MPSHIVSGLLQACQVVLPHLEGMEGGVAGIASGGCLVIKIVAKKAGFLHCSYTQELQAEREVPTLTLLPIVHLLGASLCPPGVNLHSAPRERFHRTMEEVARVREVHNPARLSAAAGAVAGEHLAELSGHKDNIGVKLQRPIMGLILAVLEDAMPHLNEDAAVEGGQGFSAAGHLEVSRHNCQSRPTCGPTARGHTRSEEGIPRDVAEEHVFIAIENTHTLHVLLRYEDGFVALRQHH